MATILDNIRNIFKTKEIQKKEAPIVSYQSLGYDVSTKIAYHDLAKEGYSENAIVYRCINEIANNATMLLKSEWKRFS